MESCFKQEAKAAAYATDPIKAKLEMLKEHYTRLEVDKRTVKIKNASLEERCTSLGAKVAELEAELSSERELREKSQHELAKESMEKD